MMLVSVVFSRVCIVQMCIRSSEPVAFRNDTCDFDLSGLRFVSGLQLRSWFHWVDIYSSDYPAPDQCRIFPTGKLLRVTVPSVSDLLAEFGQHISKNGMCRLAASHGMGNLSKVPKCKVLRTLWGHSCSPTCRNFDIVVTLLLANRLNVNKVERPPPEPVERPVVRIDADPIPETEVNVATPNGTPAVFQLPVSDSVKSRIIREWQACMDPVVQKQQPCAVCAQCNIDAEMHVVDATNLDLRCLRNDALPLEVLPTSYNLVAYQGAILYPLGLEDTTSLGYMHMCASCHQCLVDSPIPKQPLDSLANFQYYGIDELPREVKSAFDSASLFDIMMIAKYRASRITYMYKTWGPDSLNQPQGYSKGNVAILPQNTVALRTVLPPGLSEVAEAMCTLFVGSDAKPTSANIARLRPILVSKNVVETLIHFLLERNFWYHSTNVTFSQENLNAMCSDERAEASLPAGVEVCHLTAKEMSDVPGDVGDYTDRSDLLNAEEQGDDQGLIMESVGYTMGDHSPQNYKDMKAKALAWCVDRENFIKMTGGSDAINEKDPSLLSSLFPNLDPWGIGGFVEQSRRPDQHISFERQVRNLLLQHNSPFQKDPTFAYVCWNIIQKSNVNREISFKTNAASQASLVGRLEKIAPSLTTLIGKWQQNPRAVPQGPQEQEALRVLNQFKMVPKDVKGSSAYKMCRRNEIRSLLKVMGTPALFITLNPSDLTNPLVGVLGGLTVQQWISKTDAQRAIFVAEHPASAARFFHLFMRGFIDIVLGYKREGGGLFGKCTAYYGMVEAQGRGTLHCHMLIWLEGNPTPQRLRELMEQVPGYKQSVFNWLESVIKCELPSDTEPVSEPGGALPRPSRAAGVADPRMRDTPNLIGEMSDEPFATRFRAFVEDLAVECNWHKHTETCWKHLARGDPRDDAHCRMRVNGITRSLTGSVLLRRLHPRINNYNDVVIFLLRCNMDIKFIGSGEAAKALIFYVTDYITKSSLPTHVGLSALVYAIKQSNAKMLRCPNTSGATNNRSMFTKSVNSMMAHQEISHQQALSYLVGGGDNYASHRFGTLPWYLFDEFIAKDMGEAVYARNTASTGVGVVGDPTVVGDTENVSGGVSAAGPGGDGAAVGLAGDSINGSNSGVDIEQGHDNDQSRDTVSDEELDESPEMVTIRFSDADAVIGSNPLKDYTKRSYEQPFTGLSLWEHTESVMKMTAVLESRRQARNAERDAARIQDDAARGHSPTARRGRRANARGAYALGHPQIDTHVARQRDLNVVPVLLGNALPRPDTNGEAGHTRWCRAMLILFKPWRTSRDLKTADQSWDDAYIEWHVQCSSRVMNIISNTNLENECSDARDTHDTRRIQGVSSGTLMEGLDSVAEPASMDSLVFSLLSDDSVSGYFGDEAVVGDVSCDVVDDVRLDTAVINAGQAGCFNTASVELDVSIKLDETGPVSAEDAANIAKLSVFMQKAKKKKRPAAVAFEGDNAAEGSGGHSGVRRRQKEPDSTVEHLPGSAKSDIGRGGDDPDHINELRILDDVIASDVGNNTEQTRAVRAIGEHVILRDEKQLLLYVSGTGGTGKSHVIRTVIRLFEKLGIKDQLLLSAPTGCAAVLINGYTIHALTMLPQSRFKPNMDDLAALWRNVTYLVIDEISMISASFLSQVSGRMSQAKINDNPFGGVNMIFTGDFGQLRPVLQKALYNHELVARVSNRVTGAASGQTALHGAGLWRAVDAVIELTQNVRSQGDPKFANMLARIRQGAAWDGLHVMSKAQVGTGDNYTVSDYHTINTRLLSRLWRMPTERAKFNDAPIIVTTKATRDALNILKVKAFAKATGQTYQRYFAKDSFRGAPVATEIRGMLWSLRCNQTNDAIGVLPLVPGMRVMITENVAISASAVNGAEGVLQSVKYEEIDGQRYAACAYVKVPGSSLQAPGMEKGVIPIVPVKTSFAYAYGGSKFKVTRSQLPILPAYSYVDYKSQGRSLHKVLIDLSRCFTLQSAYVMLSRAHSLDGIAVLCPFLPNKIDQRLPEDLRAEFARLSMLAQQHKTSPDADMIETDY